MESPAAKIDRGVREKWKTGFSHTLQHTTCTKVSMGCGYDEEQKPVPA